MTKGWAWVGLAFAAACGARSELTGLYREGNAGAGGLPGSDASVDAIASDTGTGGGAPDAADAAVDQVSPPPCVLGLAGEPIDILSFPDRHATAPSMVTLGPSTLALQAFAGGGSSFAHPDIELGHVQIGPAWPSGTAIDLGPTLYGIESHGWGQLTRSPGGGLALGWHGDPNGVARVLFRLFDPGSWSPGPVVDVDSASDTEAVLDLQLGAGVGGLGVGYAGDGYGIVYRSVDWNTPGTPTKPLAAVLDPSGSVVIAPKEIAPAADYPGAAPSIVWTGTTYLLATARPGEVQISKLVPASGDLVDDSHVEGVSSLSSHLPNASVGRPALAVQSGRVYLAWRESAAKDPPELHAVRLAELDQNGLVVKDPLDIGSIAHPVSRVTLSASELGVLVSYAEEGDTALPDASAGRSHVVVHQLDLDASPLGDPIVIDATRFQTYGPPQLAVISQPLSALVTWSARAKQGGLDDTYLARLDCGASAPAEYAAVLGPPTALERFMLTKYDPTRQLCFRVHLAAPLQFDKYAIVVPDPWAVEKVTVTPNATSCNGYGGSDALDASSASGTLSWSAPPVSVPCAVNADLVLSFPGAPPEPFAAQAIALAGVGCDGG